MIKIHLNHSICSSCFKNYLLYIYEGYFFKVDIDLLNYHIQYPFELIKCPFRNCNYYFQIQTINAFTEEEIMKEQQIYCKGKGWINKLHEKKLCPICLNIKYLDDFVIFKKCSHYACVNCFK